MKTLKIKDLLMVLTLFALVTSCSLLPIDDIRPGSPASDKKAIQEVVAEFAKTEAAKNGDAHRELYLSASSRLNFFQKNYGSPFLASLSRDEWIGYFMSWSYDYYPEYYNQKFYPSQGMAIESHSFQGYRDSIPDIYGTDLFMYVATADGWKLVNVTSTVINPDDATDYSTVESIDANPEVVLSAFEEGLNTQDKAAFEATFMSISTPCFRFKGIFETAYADDQHSADAFYDAFADHSGLVFQLKGVQVTVYDQLVAVAKSNYIIKKDGLIIESGEMLATLGATPDMGWKITGLALSIRKQMASF